MVNYKCPNKDCFYESKVDVGGFCPECGSKLKKTSNNLLYLLIAGGGLFILLLFAFFIYLILFSTPSSNEIIDPKLLNDPSLISNGSVNLADAKFLKMSILNSHIPKIVR